MSGTGANMDYQTTLQLNFSFSHSVCERNSGYDPAAVEVTPSLSADGCHGDGSFGTPLMLAFHGGDSSE